MSGTPDIPETFPLCWSCQQVLPESNRQRVWLSSDIDLPCCRECWEQLTPAERLNIAQQYYARHDSASKSAQEAFQSFIAALRDHDAGFGRLFSPN